ncbi:sialate O-acetylesterase [Pedobacter sp.]
MRKIKYILLIGVVYFLSAYKGFAQLTLPAIFTDSLVLQRKMPIPVWGQSNCKNCELEVVLAQTKVKAKTNAKGEWMVRLPAMEAGGPYKLKIKDKLSSLELKDVLIGEVWLCSGQSNMEWMLRQATGGKEAAAAANDSEMRLFNMAAIKELRPVGGKSYTTQMLEQMKAKQFYQKTRWVEAKTATASNFSAVAYYFGKQLRNQLKVPVGLICNAIGGTSTQAFISNEALKSHPQLVQFTKQSNGKPWLSTAKEIHPWLLERITENLKNFKDDGVEIYPHPFAPSYLYETGVKPLIPYAIAGVIWYQGESNTTFAEVHDELFTALVESWRNKWAQGDFPFYFVQLPKIADRRRWPDFRESQRRLSESLTNVGMAVTIDMGDSTDVHPREKKTVGERLALIALEKKYSLPIISSGPVMKTYELKGDSLEIYFEHAKQLRTNDEKTVKGFVVHGYQNGSKEKIFDLENIKLVGNKLIAVLPKQIMPFRISYAWAPYPDCNLVNEAGIPASPFKIEIPGDK